MGRTYTDRGELYQLSHASTTIDTRSYDDGGRMTGSTYNNGVSETRGYNADKSMPTAPATNNSQCNTMYQCLQSTAYRLRPELNWDADNRLNTADVGNNSSIDLTYKFDALGRRVFRDDGTTATVFVQSGQQTIADYVSGAAASSPTYRYVYASYIDEPVLRYKPTGSESVYYHRNQQYSITALTDGSGAIVERYAYSAYGVPTITNASAVLRTVSSYDNRYMYTGREWDEAIDMYHYRARMYDAELGRFCSRDPIGFKDGPSLFAAYFVPSARDPSGTSSSVVHNGCGNRPGGVTVTAPTGVPPVVNDPALDRWFPNVQALNHVCYNVDLNCTDTADGPTISGSIQFDIFIAVPTQSIPLDPGIFGHELRHQLVMLQMIQDNIDAFTSSICGLGRKCMNCKDIEDELDNIRQGIWNSIGPAYTHRFPGSNSPGPPWPGVGGGSGHVDPVWPNDAGNPVPVAPPFPIPQRQGGPRDGQNGWVCPMDKIINGDRNAIWPDWQFQPGVIPPGVVPPKPNW